MAEVSEPWGDGMGLTSFKWMQDHAAHKTF